MTDWIEDLRAEFGDNRVVTEGAELAARSLDCWPVAIKQNQQGRLPYRPEAIFQPRHAEEVPRLLAWANRHGIPVTPRGAGSGVVGAAIPVQGGIVLDLSNLDRILILDETNLLVRAEAGVMGHRLEAELNARGYTLNHSPQSLDRSTVGGWVATRATGQFSSRWGGIEDMLLALTVALPAGEVIETRLAPRAALGPELRELFVGAEGTLGVVLDATLKISPLPERRILDTLAFASVPAGLEAMRRLSRPGLRPFLVRFYDEDESRYLRAEGATAGEENLFLVGFEGPERVAGAEYEAGMELLLVQGGVRLGPEIAERWMARRFDFSTVENRLAQPGGLAETIEIAHFWDSIEETYRALKRALTPLAEEALGHFSHAYPQGVSLYMILLGWESDAKAAEQRLGQIWETAMRVSQEQGAAISHHHGVGLARQAYLRGELGASYMVLERIKTALDPRGILNPGKLGFERKER
ncbi:MAG TPA: FAD-binding oxidoreductase [Anaerolineaceae bacterium]|nr:FAD-binding oxidoreductase [Anaerolineaceae bacterium]